MKILIALLFVLITTSCTIEKLEKPEGLSPSGSLNKLSSYFVYGTSYGEVGIDNFFTFYDAKGNIIKQEILNTEYDIFYDEININTNKYYLFGNGGLFEIDLESEEITKINNEPVTALTFDTKDNLYYYINGGFDETSYNSLICSLENKCIELDKFVFDFEFYKDVMFVSTSDNSLEEFELFEINNDAKIERRKIDYYINGFYIINNILYGINPYGLYCVENDLLLPFYQESNEVFLETPKPIIKEIDGKIFIVDNYGKRIFSAVIKDEKVELVIEKDLEQFYLSYLSLNEDLIILHPTNNKERSVILNLQDLSIEILPINFYNEKVISTHIIGLK